MAPHENTAQQLSIERLHFKITDRKVVEAPLQHNKQLNVRILSNVWATLYSIINSLTTVKHSSVAFYLQIWIENVEHLTPSLYSSPRLFLQLSATGAWEVMGSSHVGDYHFFSLPHASENMYKAYFYEYFIWVKHVDKIYVCFQLQFFTWILDRRRGNLIYTRITNRLKLECQHSFPSKVLLQYFSG